MFAWRSSLLTLFSAVILASTTPATSVTASELPHRCDDRDTDLHLTRSPDVKGEIDPALGAAIELERTWNHERRVAIQDALVWAGHYSGRLNGDLSGPTRLAIRRFQAEIGSQVTGYLSSDDLEILNFQHDTAKEAAGFRMVDEADLGIRVGLPLALIRRSTVAGHFINYEPLDQAAGTGLMLIAMEGTRADLRTQKIVLTASELVGDAPLILTHRDWFVIAGTYGQFRSFSLLRLENGVMRGFMLTWTVEADDQFRHVATAILNSFRAIGGQTIDPAQRASR